MATKDPAPPGFKEKATREMIDFLRITLYLAVFFCALVTYTTLVLKSLDVKASFLNYSLALLNAFVIGKVIVLGEMVRIGRHADSRPVYQIAIYKSILFSLLAFVFHLLEEFVKGVIRGEPAGASLHQLEINMVLARALVIFCAFLPLFAFRELRRALGEERLYAIFRSPLPRGDFSSRT